MKKTVVMTILLIFSLLGCTTTSTQSKADTPVKKSEKTDVFELSLDTVDGNAFSVSELRTKKPIYVSFWATWCDPCKSELLKLRDAYDRYKDKMEFVAVAIDTGDTIEMVKEFAIENSIPFPVLIDPDNNTVSSLIPGGDTVPYAILVDRAGNVVYTHTGYEPGDEEKLFVKFDELLK